MGKKNQKINFFHTNKLSKKKKKKETWPIGQVQVSGVIPRLGIFLFPSSLCFFIFPFFSFIFSKYLINRIYWVNSDPTSELMRGATPRLVTQVKNTPFGQFFWSTSGLLQLENCSVRLVFI